MHKLYQEDFEECIALRRVLRQAEKKVKAKEKYIAAGVRAGVEVEPGLYSPELVKVKRKGYKVASGSYYRLEFQKS